MTTHSNITRFATAFAAGMVLVVASGAVYARPGGNVGKTPISSTQGTPCKGPACNVQAPTGGIYAPPDPPGRRHHGGGCGLKGCR